MDRDDWSTVTARTLAQRLREVGIEASMDSLAAMLDRRVQSLVIAMAWTVERARTFLEGDGLTDIVAFLQGA